MIILTLNLYICITTSIISSFAGVSGVYVATLCVCCVGHRGYGLRRLSLNFLCFAALLCALGE